MDQINRKPIYSPLSVVNAPTPVSSKNYIDEFNEESDSKAQKIENGEGCYSYCVHCCFDFCGPCCADTVACCLDW